MAAARCKKHRRYYAPDMCPDCVEEYVCRRVNEALEEAAVGVAILAEGVKNGAGPRGDHGVYRLEQAVREIRRLKVKSV